jgi:Spy/CpxP family protein refolding chaperone
MNEDTAKRKAAAWVAIVFLLGAALGGVFGYFYGHRAVVAAAAPPRLTEPEKRARGLDRMTHELGLTDSQRQQIDALMLQIHKEYDSIHQKNDAELETEMDQARQKGRERIRALLTPDQLPKYEELVKRVDEERKKNSPPPGMPPGPPPSR